MAVIQSGADVAINHAFVSGKANGADPTFVQPSNWNAGEVISAGADGQRAIRDSGNTHGASWIDCETGSFTNNTAAGAAAGDVVAVSGVADKTVILEDTLASTKKFVVALQTPANAAAGAYGIAGPINGVKAQGAIAAGQFVRKSATTKAVEDAGVALGASPPTGALGFATTAAAGGFVNVFWFVQTAVSATAGNVRATFGRLRVFSDPDEPSQRMRVLCDESVLVDSTGASKTFPAIDVMADLGSAGAGGLDTGSIAASTEYDLYVIGKPDGTVNAMYSKGLQWTKDQDYADGNRDGTLALRDANARTAIAQGFKVATSAKLHSVEVSMLKVTTPAGSIWGEIQTDNAGVPSNTLVTGGRGMLVAVDDMDATNRFRMRMIFPERPALTSGTQYHFVLKGDYTVGASLVNVGIDGSAPTYANGAVSTMDNTNTWTADATKDFALFTVNTLVGSEIPYTNIPSGYTYAGRVSWNKTDGSSILCRMFQTDEWWQHVIKRDTGTSATITTWLAFDISAFSPAAWVKEYRHVLCSAVNGSEGFMADGLPIGNANGGATFATYGMIGAYFSTGGGAFTCDVHGQVGPMVWMGNVAASSVRILSRGFKLSL